MYQKYFVNQKSEYDCGIACLSMIFKLNKINILYENISKSINKDGEMISLYDIIRFSNKNHLRAEGYKNVHINNVKTPCIAHIVQNNIQHFVVILKILKDKVLIADPASRIMYVKKTDFEKKYTGVVIQFNKSKDLLRDIFHNKNLIIKEITLSIVVVLFSIISSYTLPYATKIIKNTHMINLYILCISLLYLIKTLVNYIKSKAITNFQLSIDEKITIPIINKIISLPHMFYHNHGSGYLMSLINDSSYIKEIIMNFIEIVIINLFLSFIICLITLYINPIYFLINVVLIFAIIIINKYFLKILNSYAYDYQNSNLLFNNYFISVLSNILQIKNLNKESYYKQKLTSDYESLLNINKDISKIIRKKDFTISLVTSLSYIIFMYLVLNKGSLFSLLFIMSIEETLISSLNEIGNILPLYSNYKIAYKRTNELYNKDELNSTNNKININNISFKNVKYKKVLKDINFNINKGDWIMINGPVGSGKSTLFKLLTKQINYSGDSIFINGNTINYYQEEELRNSILYVDQKQRLINDTIYNNIFFDSKINNKVLKASTINKDKTIIGDEYINNTSSNISGGQLNKIIIAQSLNRNCDVIIFDEVACNLDDESEIKILNNIKSMFGNKTIIYITHRKTNVNLFNKVITISDGEAKIIKGGI